jgi:hypothetical protein
VTTNDYRIIANVIRGLRGDRVVLAHAFSNALEREDPGFDRTTFVLAAVHGIQARPEGKQ